VLDVSGAAGDGGIDLLGKWHFPLRRIVPVVVQCKSHSRELSPQSVHEFDSVLTKRGRGSLGILVSDRGFSVEGERQGLRCASPLCLARVDGKSRLRGFIMNRSARDMIPELSVAIHRAAHGFRSIDFLYSIPVIQ